MREGEVDRRSVELIKALYAWGLLWSHDPNTGKRIVYTAVAWHENTPEDEP